MEHVNTGLLTAVGRYVDTLKKPANTIGEPQLYFAKFHIKVYYEYQLNDKKKQINTHYIKKSNGDIYTDSHMSQKHKINNVYAF